MKRSLFMLLIAAASLTLVLYFLLGGHVLAAESSLLLATVAAAPAADIDGLSQQFERHHETVKTLLDDANARSSEVDSRLKNIEQELARKSRGSSSDLAPETWGAQVLKSENARQMTSGWKGAARFDVKAVITSATADADGSAGALLTSHRPGMIDLPRRKLRIRSLFAQGETSANSIEYPKLSGRTIAAATVAESNPKPRSDLKFALVNWPVRTIAHWVIASRQILDDAPALMSIIDSELRYGLDLVEDGQLLNGGGTGVDLSGVYTTAEAFDPPIEAPMNATELDVLLQAIAQVDNSDYDADGIVLNPLDWRKMQLLKDAQDRYLGGGPFSDLVSRLWQMPIVTSKSMSQGKFLVGAFKQGAQIFDRQDATVEVSTEDGDNFRNNLVTILGEKRLAFVVKHTDVFVKGDFAEALSQ